MDISTEIRFRQLRAWFARNHVSILALVVSVIALGATARSCSISAESNAIAQRALSSSDNAFVAQNRPYLVITPKKSESNTNLYLTVTGSSTSATVQILYHVKNVGVVPAEAIEVLPESSMRWTGTAILSGEARFSFGGLPAVSLAPGEKWGLIHKQDLLKVGGGADMASILTHFTNGTLSAETDVSLAYRAASMPGRVFTTRARHEFAENLASLRDSTFEERESNQTNGR